MGKCPQPHTGIRRILQATARNFSDTAKPNQKFGVGGALCNPRNAYRLVVNSRLTKAELAAYADHRGYKPGWVWHRLQEQGASA